MAAVSLEQLNDDLSGRSSPGGTKIPRVMLKPPTGGSTVVKPRQIARRSSGSAPNSRCTSPAPKQNGTSRIQGIEKKSMSPVVNRRSVGSTGLVKHAPGSPAIGRRPPGSPVVKRASAIASPSPRRNSFSKTISACDRPPSPAIGQGKIPKSSAKSTRVDEEPKMFGTRRVPTPMVPRKDIGASLHSETLRSRSPIPMNNSQVIDDIPNDDLGDDDLDEEISLITGNGSNKENRLSTSLTFKPNTRGISRVITSTSKDTEDLKTSECKSQDKKETISIPSTGSAQKMQTVLKNANNNSEAESRFDVTDQAPVAPLKFNRNFQRQIAVIEDSKPAVDTMDNQGKGHFRRHSTGIMLSSVVDRCIVMDEAGNRCITADINHCNTPIHTSVGGYSDNNMNRCTTSAVRTSGHQYTMATSDTPSALSRTSISMSLPILSNGQYMQNNNNNIKNLLSPSSLTDVIPKNAGEELYVPKFEDSSMFVSGQNGYPVILPDALELGGQALCDGYDELRSPISPTVDGLLSPTSPSSENKAAQFFSNLDVISKSQSCPNLAFEEPKPEPAMKRESFIDTDDVYEKYPPIRHLDVNKLDLYREEQLREYYEYLQKQQAEWAKNGLLNNTENSGQEVQRISVITQLPTLLNPENNSECMRRVVPKIREVLHVAQPDMQLAACSAFLQILQEDKVPLQNYTQTFLRSILTSIDNRDPDVANAWMDTLLDVIDLLPKDVIKKDIMSLAISKGQLSQSVQSRLSCCRILGKVATKFDTFIIKKDILPIVQSLCQDVDYEVRGCMCRQLDSVARGLGLEQTKSAILPELVELTNDEESYVRLAGLDTVVNILSLLDDDTCTQTIIPLVCKFCQQALSNEDSTLPNVAKHLGKLCHGLSVNLNEEQKHWFVDYYHKLCKYGASESSKLKEEREQSNPKPITPFPMFGSDLLEEEDQAMETRKNSGFNFPAMVMFVGTKHFKSELFSSFHSLCSDCHYNVRKTIACGFHEVAKLLANHASILLPEFINLLQDDSTEVLTGLIEHLPESLEALIKSANLSTSDNKAHVYNDLMVAMLSSEGVIFASNNWRLQEELMKQLACMTKCFSSDQIFQKFMPLLFRKVLTAKALPVKLEACRTILLLMRQNRRLEQRDEICDRLIEDVCRSDSCHKRSLFIDLCKMVLELYSRAFFKEYFYEPLIELTADRVPNVRLKLCPLLPKLKMLIKLPGDRNRLQLLEQGVRRILVNETDRDVLEAIEKSVKALDAVQVPMDSLSNKKGVYADDIADQKKEDEEKYLLDLEEQDRRDEEIRSAKGERKKDASNKKDGASTKIPAPKRGSKIPAATNVSKEKVSSASSSRSERSSSFTGTSSAHNQNSKTKVGSKEYLDSPSPGKRGGAGSATSTGSRKSSATSLTSNSSNSSVGSTKTRRASIPNSLVAAEIGKKSSGPNRKLSVGSLTANGNSASSRKK